MGWSQDSPSSVILPADHIPFQKSVSQYKETCLLILDPDQIYFLILSNFHINSSAKVHIYMYCLCGQSIHKMYVYPYVGWFYRREMEWLPGETSHLISAANSQVSTITNTWSIENRKSMID